jgi:ATP-dependent Lhr-like helicase
MSLDNFHPVISQWFREKFSIPTDVQDASWPPIHSGIHTLIAAPTGSGKTLAAFLSCIDRLFKQCLSGELENQVQVLYVSPLKALSNDIQKNLHQPLAQISQAALSAGYLTPEIRAEVRTGDTPQKDRQRLLQHPPHILITTPESLFLLLTGPKSRSILQTVRTVIVDEIHALAGNKRGTHLALSLERLEALTHSPPTRIGLSATQRPIEDIAQFLVGQRVNPSQPLLMSDEPQSCHIVNMGQHRTMDLAIEVPKDELSSIASNAIWSDIYDRLTELVLTHQSTLIFVNTRRLAERIAHHLTERLGEDAVATHHGSLSRKMRLSAETRLKNGETRAVVATASLELGIDIGAVDLVCQIGSPRAIATCLQRIGRAGHWVGAIPKGRLFCSTRDELIECAALIQGIRHHNLDRLHIPPSPLDILSQQLVATIANEEWTEDGLFQMVKKAYPYKNLSRTQFDAITQMLAQGFIPERGRQQAYVFHDRAQKSLRPRRGARLAALTSGGAIPDTATYAVIAEPHEIKVGTVDEDFAIESLAGDIILLGNTSWRIRKVEMGTVRVEDAQGAPPNIPFWRGEAPARTAELSEEVANLRQLISNLLTQEESSTLNLTQQQNRNRSPNTSNWLQTECGVDKRGAEQIIDYLRSNRQALGTLPTQQHIIAERFFDEAGGMQLVIHSPFGGRVNRAWGLALRKRFCLSFDFELQAAATDEGLVLSLGEKHSFPLEAIFQMLHPETARDVLIQAILASPMFIARWRWNTSRALALLRFRQGKRVPLHIQRMRAEDLLSAVFPMATACQDNHVGDIPIPNHPIVEETIRDCLHEAMDLNGLVTLLTKIKDGSIQCHTIESPTPSPLSHEILNANPYAFLDDAPLEERRARAVNLRHILPAKELREFGVLDPIAIATVVEEAWPTVRDSDELQEILHSLIWVPEISVPQWTEFLEPLLHTGRATIATLTSSDPQELQIRGWIASEYASFLPMVFPEFAIEFFPGHHSTLGDPQEKKERYELITQIVRNWMECLGPTTALELSHTLHLPLNLIEAAFQFLEGEGQILRGQFRSPQNIPQYHENLSKTHTDTAHSLEWCDRRLLARIHRRTVKSLRQEIEPVSAADFMRYLFRWQHVMPSARLHGESGLLEVLRQLSGYEAAAAGWEPHLLSSRLMNYRPDHLDYLCLRGTITWGRLSPPTMEEGPSGYKRKQRITPTSVAPICLFPREDSEWLIPLARKSSGIQQAFVPEILSSVAQDIHQYLHQYGASFFGDLVKGTQHLQAEVEQALWELASVGLVTADGFDNLRALLNPHRRRGERKNQGKRPGHTIGRWVLLHRASHQPIEKPPSETEISEAVAQQLLKRYGIVFRDLLKREALILPWRDLLVHFRRLELRGEIRGGRFVAGFTGEQFALPDALEALRAVRKDPQIGAQEVRISGVDPLNLAGIILPGPKIPAIPNNVVVFRDGVTVKNVDNLSVSA